MHPLLLSVATFMDAIGGPSGHCCHSNFCPTRLHLRAIKDLMPHSTTMIAIHSDPFVNKLLKIATPSQNPPFSIHWCRHQSQQANPFCWQFWRTISLRQYSIGNPGIRTHTNALVICSCCGLKSGHHSSIASTNPYPIPILRIHEPKDEETFKNWDNLPWV